MESCQDDAGLRRHQRGCAEGDELRARRAQGGGADESHDHPAAGPCDGCMPAWEGVQTTRVGLAEVPRAQRDKGGKAERPRPPPTGGKEHGREEIGDVKQGLLTTWHVEMIKGTVRDAHHAMPATNSVARRARGRPETRKAVARSQWTTSRRPPEVIGAPRSAGRLPPAP